MHSLLYRCRELGLLSDSSASRAYQRLHDLQGQPGVAAEPLTGYPGEQPALLAEAFNLACEHGLSIADLAHELAWTVPRVRQVLGVEEQRPVLRLVGSEAARSTVTERHARPCRLGRSVVARCSDEHEAGVGHEHDREVIVPVLMCR